jgi:hypothetical protein
MASLSAPISVARYRTGPRSASTFRRSPSTAAFSTCRVANAFPLGCALLRARRGSCAARRQAVRTRRGFPARDPASCKNAARVSSARCWEDAFACGSGRASREDRSPPEVASWAYAVERLSIGADSQLAIRNGKANFAGEFGEIIGMAAGRFLAA